jgi:hypothetical protein
VGDDASSERSASSPPGERPYSACSNDSGDDRAHGKSVGPRKLLEIVEKVYKSFNPATCTLDTHIENSLKELQLPGSHDDTFVRQVVYGIVRYRSFLGCIMDSFYHYNGYALHCASMASRMCARINGMHVSTLGTCIALNGQCCALLLMQRHCAS